MDFIRLRKQEELIFNWATDKGILEKGNSYRSSCKNSRRGY